MGFQKAHFFKGKYDHTKLEFPDEWGGGEDQTKKPSMGGMDIFWNNKTESPSVPLLVCWNQCPSPVLVINIILTKQ